MNQTSSFQGWVCYDSDCPFCVNLAGRAHLRLIGKGFTLVPLQSPWVSQKIGLTGQPLLTEMKVITPCGQMLGGAAALLHLARFFWWGRPLAVLGRVPLIYRLLARGYSWIAANRYCFGGSCSLANHQKHSRRAHHRLSSFYDLDSC